MSEASATQKTETAPVPVDPKVALDQGNKLFDEINRKLANDLSTGKSRNIGTYGLIPIHGMMSMGADQKDAEKFSDEHDAAREGTIYAFGRVNMTSEERKEVVDFLATQELINIRLYGVACAIQFNKEEENEK